VFPGDNPETPPSDFALGSLLPHRELLIYRKLHLRSSDETVDNWAMNVTSVRTAF